MNNWIIVSYYTKNYTDIAYKYLIPSVKKLNLPHYITEIPNLNNWKEATDYKPIFINNCLTLHKSDLVFIDCDATVNEYPELFDRLNESAGIHIAYHYLSWETHYGRPKDKDRFEFASGTLYFRNNEKIKQLIIEWIKNTKIYSPEQKALEIAIKYSKNLHTFDLPRSYSYINSTPRGEPATKLDNPIITHYQASREKNG